jgi:hypothetical protein
LVVGTTCRAGLYRDHVKTRARWRQPRRRASSGKVAVIFGPEDHGLSNKTSNPANIVDDTLPSGLIAQRRPGRRGVSLLKSMWLRWRLWEKQIQRAEASRRAVSISARLVAENRF